MSDYTNFGLSLLENAEKKFEKDKKKKKEQYNERHHDEVKMTIYLLKQKFMINTQVIEVDAGAEELKTIVDSQYITFGGKTYSLLHEEVVSLKINKGKGRLTITEVEVIEKEVKNDSKPMRRIESHGL
jgi:hypothetical protein